MAYGKWVTKHHVLTAKSLQELSDKMDEVCEKKFIIASNVFQVGMEWQALLYEKVRVYEEQQKPKSIWSH